MKEMKYCHLVALRVNNQLVFTMRNYGPIEMFQVSRDKLLAPARNIPGVQVRDGSLRCSRL